jgi:hypothetical protein
LWPLTLIIIDLTLFCWLLFWWLFSWLFEWRFLAAHLYLLPEYLVIKDSDMRHKEYAPTHMNITEYQELSQFNINTYILQRNRS